MNSHHCFKALICKLKCNGINITKNVGYQIMKYNNTFYKLSMHNRGFCSIGTDTKKNDKNISNIKLVNEDDYDDNNEYDIDDEEEFIDDSININAPEMPLQEYMHGRKNRERRDSVNEGILLERFTHQERISKIEVTPSQIKEIESMGLGTKRKRNLVYRTTSGEKTSLNRRTLLGAGGFAVHLASASSNFPVFKHILPEVAFAGHSNSGKSTLVNAISGLSPRTGPASVSERAGWTDQICFYQLGKRPPLLNLADLPGYGHAVATIGNIIHIYISSLYNQYYVFFI
jgi:ribosome biogenesis GTPase A